MPSRKKPRLPVVSGIIASMRNVRDYVVGYDCPRCGAVHHAQLHEIPPLELTPPCGKGPIILQHAFDECEGEEDE